MNQARSGSPASGQRPGLSPALSSLALILASGAAACTATIERRHLPEIEARIVSSDRDSVVIEEDGKLFRVAGSDITDIDHPGSALVVVGVVVGGLALLMADSGNLGDRANADGMAVIGLGLALGGAIPWFRSTGAAEGFEDH